MDSDLFSSSSLRIIFFICRRLSFSDSPRPDSEASPRQVQTSQNPEQIAEPQATKEHSYQAPIQVTRVEDTTPTIEQHKSTIPNMFDTKPRHQNYIDSITDTTSTLSTESRVSMSMEDSEPNINRSELSLVPVSRGSRAMVNPGYIGDNGLLWPDVVDPYHRSAVLEMQIGGRALDVHNRNSLEDAIQRLHYY